MFWPQEDKIHIFWKPCIVLFIIWATKKLLWRFKNFGKSSEIFESVRKSSEIFGKLWTQFKSVSRCFYDFLNFSENLRKSSKVFGNLRKFSETLDTVQKCFQMFLWFFKFFWKSSEIFGSVRKYSEIFGKLRKRFKNNLQKFSENLRKCSEIFGDILTSEDMENILRGPRLYCHMDSMSGLF